MYLRTDLELPGALDLECGVEGHLEVVALLVEDALERLLEQRRVERVAHHHVAAAKEQMGINE